MSFPEKLKKFLSLSTITMIISILAAIGVVIVSIMMMKSPDNKSSLLVLNAAFMLAVAASNLTRAVVIDKQKSLAIIWGAAVLIFIAGLIYAIIN